MKKIIRFCYLLWVCFTIAYVWIHFTNNYLLLNGYLVTFIVFTALSVLIIIFIKKIQVKTIIVSLLLGIITVSIFFKTYTYPELMILSIGRFYMLLISLIILFPLRIRIPAIIKTIITNIVIFIVLFEIILHFIFLFTGIDILKRKNEIVRIMPGQKMNNVIVNEHGYIGTPPNERTDKSQWCFIGDSFGIGIVDYRFNFIKMIEDSSEKQTVNLSQPGFSPLDYYKQMIKYVHQGKYEKCFIVIFTGNDISEWRFEENNWSYKKSRIYCLISNIVYSIRFRDFANGESDFTETQFIDIECRRALFNEFPDEELWNRFRKVINEMNEYAREMKIELVYILIPDEYTINSDLQNEINRKTGINIDFMLIHNRVLRLLKSLNCIVIDSYPYIYEMNEQGINPYKPFNTHINRDGNYAVYRSVIMRNFLELIDNGTAEKLNKNGTEKK